jgi:hypothetical protein
MGSEFGPSAIAKLLLDWDSEPKLAAAGARVKA